MAINIRCKTNTYTLAKKALLDKLLNTLPPPPPTKQEAAIELKEYLEHDHFHPFPESKPDVV